MSGTDLILLQRTQPRNEAQDDCVSGAIATHGDCEFEHANCHTRPVLFASMEFLLLWWDDLDDLAHACRHLATSAFSEVAAASSPLAAGLSAMSAWLLLRLHS